ncbi:MAG: RnfABCDGE type electron transport complex subunit C, partial [Leptotrichia sp.]|nr:RnfABCDGE type electron transport complex subunit C [Leptotrichia sp.]
IDTFIVNGAECEPYLTADYTIMSNYVEELLGGIKIAEKLLRPREVVIGIEEENIDIAEHIEVIIKQSRLFNVKVQVLPTAYPQGSELQLIRSVTGKEIKKGEIPGNHGIIVSNVGTVKSMYDAFTEGKPLVERVVTVSGEKVKTKGNYLLKVGTPLSHIIEQLNPEDNAKIVFGGPMMGEEVTETSTPVVKGTSGILFLSKDIDSVKRENCISCGYCVDVCPMGLMPMKFAESYRKEQYEKLVTVYHLDNCIECGACEYVCPSRVPLIKSIKEGKEKLRETGEMK